MAEPDYTVSHEKARPGVAFSNGTEFDIWYYRTCTTCVHDQHPEVGCALLAIAFTSDRTPSEWVPHPVAHGSYTCESQEVIPQ